MVMHPALNRENEDRYLSGLCAGKVLLAARYSSKVEGSDRNRVPALPRSVLCCVNPSGAV